MAALVGTKKYKLGGIEHPFGLLTAEDMVSLTYTIPGQTTGLIDTAGLNVWASNPKGCESFLELASKNAGVPVSVETIRKWGSMNQRRQVAAQIFVDSMMSGEEEAPDPNEPGPAAAPGQ